MRNRFNFDHIIKAQNSSEALFYDHGCFMIWETALPFLSEIKTDLQSRFEILLETEIHWSEAHFYRNAFRLYEIPLFKNDKNLERHSAIAEKIGSHSFVVFIVKDHAPRYGHTPSVSGKIEFSNLNIIELKKAIRKEIFDKTGVQFGVHSSNNAQEFFYQAPLMLGTQLVNDLLDNKKITQKKFVRDTEGVSGWNNYNDLFKFLNISCNYLVLRNFEAIRDEHTRGDIDFLTNNFQRLASAMGATQLSHKPFKAEVKIANTNVSLDLRFIGDNYLPAVWQHRMLKRKILKNNIYIPSETDHFFSLLFHCKVQKETVNPEHINTLAGLSEGLNFKWFTSEAIHNETEMSEILRGYFVAEGYYFESPIDKAVYNNTAITGKLPKKGSVLRKGYGATTLKTMAKNVLPEPIFRLLKAAKAKLS
ncbi:hypothetical protein [Constantimarinum furrinae]|uniref:Uncharacterized protein n=1 Tax=Constantimarinum furrinae TaxID=2562285 RepID=A0A7G8PX89_9FLAO|nr:hypothetical protein [Constantimarinum furrinae]QNJ98955.1 hypothetical protein ALE3EI_2417 [Constantimarinum furrinae]